MGRIAHEPRAPPREHRWRMASEPHVMTDSPGGALNADVARAVVRVYRSFRGRGPTKARALFKGDIVVVVLEDVMTELERALVTSGRSEAALATRRHLHDVMVPELKAAIARLTGAHVKAAMGQSHSDPDMAVEVFVLDAPIDPRVTLAGWTMPS